jgi:hypothetical protein
MDSADCLPVVRFGCEADTPRPPVVYRLGAKDPNWSSTAFNTRISDFGTSAGFCLSFRLDVGPWPTSRSPRRLGSLIIVESFHSSGVGVPPPLTECFERIILRPFECIDGREVRCVWGGCDVIAAADRGSLVICTSGSPSGAARSLQVLTARSRSTRSVTSRATATAPSTSCSVSPFTIAKDISTYSLRPLLCRARVSVGRP